MGVLNRVQKCYHCGAILQSKDKNGIGYITPDVFKQFPDGLLLCNNCYKNEKFSNMPKEASFDSEYQAIIDEAKRKKALIVYTIDLLNFEGSFNSKMIELLKGLDVLVVANKRDLLPEDASEENLKKYVLHRLNLLDLFPAEVIITATGKNCYNIDVLKSFLEANAKDKDVYFFGASTSGKSALISELLRVYDNSTNKMIITYNFKNSSLRGMRIPINDSHYVYETPGTVVDNSILAKVEKSIQNQLILRKRLVPKTITMVPNQVLMLGGLACIEFLSGPKTVFTLYANNNLETKIKKGEAENIFAQYLKKGNLKLISDNFSSFKDFDAYEIEIKEEGSRDIGIIGLGWMSCNGSGQILRIYVPRGVYVYTTRSKIEHVNKQK